MHCSPYCTDICQAKLSLTEKGVKEQSAWDKKKKDQSKETQHKLVNLTDNEGIKKEETKIILWYEDVCHGWLIDRIYFTR